ncbi:3-oxoacyl-(acyl-carrier-protein) synthase [Actinokineospora baliensis]|uniref:beta-ketoacyl synthase N-terminal-like domain-containing protein n=1 Tax=Actinokineospora baliensis TaxID=547056 RepID=UPI001959AC26|nr:beta-ketoacyl synthase N-terminal-like domain-containing protein [Actinokineospora baliensis]MBM7774663.1 3-oxoacyl-(acyl-carrier-protein) synthase [Actinokineospora baliensis]
MSTDERDDTAIAVVGMACRLPGAPDTTAFWRNLRGGVDSISSFTIADAVAEGVPEAVLREPDHVRAGGLLDDIEGFDVTLFGLTRREAALVDPQQRLFLECAWAALEDAGCDPARFAGRIGVIGGVSASTYRLRNLAAQAPGPVRTAARSQLTLGTDKDFLATRVSYHLGLTGPSITVQAACASSLAAVHLACQALLLHQSDLVLVGGASIHVPQRAGYRYEPGGIFAPDGVCRPFDAKAAGTVPGSGAGVVALKRLADARRDGDQVLALVLGSAMNNDGREKASFTAPGVGAQTEVVAEAQAVAGVDPAEVSYVEANGTGTALGDPIEVRALSRAFAGAESCALGSVKSAIGHLDAAAGIAGLIKTVLALRHRELPPTPHFERPNPACEFESGPFRVNDRLRPWASDGPRTAGVCAFGIGGTNVHVVLREAPRVERGGGSGPVVLPVSAATPAALSRAAADLATHLRAHPDQDLVDIAWTLQTGRRELPHRLAVVAHDHDQAAAALTGSPAAGAPPVLTELAQRWSGGGSVDWTAVTPPGARRVSLPHYPFERIRCWIDPEPAVAGAASRSESTVEQVVAEVWRRGFGLDREIGVDEDFHQLGGRSLLLVTMATELRDRLGTRVPVALLHDNPTIAGMTRALVGVLPATAAKPAGPDTRPLSPEQEEIWLRCQSAPASARNLELVLSLTGELRWEVLVEAWRGLALRHPLLRAGIDIVAGAPVHRIAADPQPPVTLVDAQHVPEADRAEYARALVRDHLRAGFDAGGPRWRVVVVALGPRDHLMAACWDEVVCDGRSREVIAREWLARYDAGARGSALDLPDTADLLAGFVARRRAWLETPEAARAFTDGATALRGGAPLALRRPGPSVAPRRFQGARLRSAVPAPVAAGLREYCRSNGTTLYLCLLTAFDALLAARAGATDVVAATNVVNREDGAEDLVGNFTTAMLTRLSWTGDPAFGELLERARVVVGAARGRQAAPAIGVLGRLGWDEFGAVGPGNQVSVAVLHRDGALGVRWPAATGGLEARLVRFPLGWTLAEIGVQMIENDEEMTLTLDYDVDRWTAEAATGLRADIDTVLGRVAARPRARLTELLDGVGAW